MEGLRKQLTNEPSQKGKRLSSAYKDARRERAERLKADQWRFHDLRRTAVTGASIDAIKALTQHKTAGVIGIYARHAFTSEKKMREVLGVCAERPRMHNAE